MALKPHSCYHMIGKISRVGKVPIVVVEPGTGHVGISVLNMSCKLCSPFQAIWKKVFEGCLLKYTAARVILAPAELSSQAAEPKASILDLP